MLNSDIEISNIRRYDIDWLRIILFGLLIPFHVAVGLVWNTYGNTFNADGGSVNNNPGVVTSSLFLLWMHQWRLPALFMISGMGTAFAFRRRTVETFIKERANRLLIPLLFGMLVVNMIFWWLVVYDNLPNDTQDSRDLFNNNPVLWGLIVWAIIAFISIIAFPDVNLHLWFLVNLFVYSLILAPLFGRVNKSSTGFLVRFTKRIIGFGNGFGFLFILPIPLILIELILKPNFIGYTGHGYEFWWYLIFFLIGYGSIIAKDEYYQVIRRLKYIATGLAIIFSVIFLKFYESLGEKGDYYVNGGWANKEEFFHNADTILISVIHSLHAWFWCVAIFSWGAQLLNRPSSNLTYLNQAVYPFYIVHMSFVFLGLFIIRDLGIPDFLIFIIVTIFTFLGCWGVFELVKRKKWTRSFFGIKESSTICSSCNFSVRENNKFCTSCGSVVQKTINNDSFTRISKLN
ncbi:MAG: Glucans biosynthesis protein C [Candidatus Heimdallarchaeota archaeon LC_2]|nr:MAG: Glucans biosynthesis protein C [Candidatus Heimdallarchaeota archaeon LC_2]